MSHENLFQYLLRLGDNALIAGQRLGEMVTRGPELEEELATANFALDYIGQARLFYSLAAEVEGKSRSEDDLAFLRDGSDYHNILLLEQPNGDFAMTIARLFLFESFYQLQLQQLANSANAQIAEIATKAIKEVQYHVRHARQWLIRLGDGTAESHERMQSAIDELWRFTGEMFAADEIDAWAADEGIGPDLASLHGEWTAFVTAAMNEATLQVPTDTWMADGGKQGRHTEHLGYLLAEMQFLQRAYPGAKW